MINSAKSMKILQLHNRYQIVGGEEGVVQAEKQLLESHGHQVRLLEVTNDDLVGAKAKLAAAIGAIYSQSSKQQVLGQLRSFQPDIVHVHNFFPLLSPSVYDACQEAGIPVVQTLHNYRLICPKAMLFREGKVCEVCVGKSVAIAGIQSGCYRGSKAQTAVVAAMLSYHQWRGTWAQRVTTYIALTEFQKQKLIEGGLPAEKIQVKCNFVEMPDLEPVERQNFVLFVGRLAEEKGVTDLIAAYRQAQSLEPSNPAVLPPLKIVGDGPLKTDLMREVEQAGLTSQITFLGRQEKSQVLNLMQLAQVLVFPSIWYEGFPLTLAEAFACGLPAIVPNLGSMAEIVQPGVTGFHFISRDVEDLVKVMRAAVADSHHLTVLSSQAKQAYEQNYTAEINYDRLLAIYQRAMNADPETQV
jgi:glycosyltransferase involved in cell wall biosynthesis